ncbi:MAG TPA: nucleotidyltransferase domain-containing protein [Candidatus Nanoarchaeia archaeon]|nr:nucleotidyltransferase domain-containing protein [Candidatus Nanoarchaeia archaeon]
MLEILNTFAPFFEDSYRSISVREYAKLVKISPPTASKILKEFTKENYLQQRGERKHLFFTLNIENETVIDLCRLYWKQRLQKLSQEFQKKLTGASGILFGSLAKGEAKSNSDIDLVIFAPERKNIDLKPFEKQLGRKISLYWFKSLNEVQNEHLRNNILNGMLLFGKLKWL